MNRREKLVQLRVAEFDLRRTLESGQVFHAMPEGNGWQILVDRTLLYAEQAGRALLRLRRDRRILLGITSPSITL